MQIGHINLAKSSNGAGKHFVNLVEALQALDMRQHVLVRNVALAKRLDLVEGVTVGPAVRSAVMAYCLMPPVDVVHIHDPSEGQSGLLLTLTRSIPFVLTHRDASQLRNPLAQAIYRRASGIVYQGDVDAAKHLRIYKHAVENWRAVAPLA
ncbi:MAG: glycosyltransferase [Woeseiaceae bacterium]